MDMDPQTCYYSDREMSKRHSKIDLKRGQTMIEYIVMAAMLVLTISIMSILLYTIKQNSNRTVNLMSSEYP